MTRRKQPKSQRWANKTPEERSAELSAVAKRGRLTTEDRAAVAWLRENLPALASLLGVPTYVNPAPADVRQENIDAGPFAENPAETSSVEPGTYEIVDVATEQARTVLDLCSVCMSPIYDLDAPCETCVQAGRLSATPPVGHGSDIQELQDARASMPAAEWINLDAREKEPVAPHPLDVPGGTPPITSVRLAEPTISAAIHRAPLPDPPARPHSHRETCNQCGRLADLHQSHGGPIGHSFEPLPNIPE